MKFQTYFEHHSEPPCDICKGNKCDFCDLDGFELHDNYYAKPRTVKHYVFPDTLTDEVLTKLSKQKKDVVKHTLKNIPSGWCDFGLGCYDELEEWLVGFKKELRELIEKDNICDGKCTFYYTVCDEDCPAYKKLKEILGEQTVESKK